MNFKDEIAKRISSLIGTDVNETINLLEIPPKPEMGDYAFPCFQLAKTMRKAPQLIASELSLQIGSDSIIERTEVVGGYLNFYLNRVEYMKAIIPEIINTADYGSSSLGAGQTVVVEFSSPNIAKPFHVGHVQQ